MYSTNVFCFRVSANLNSKSLVFFFSFSHSLQFFLLPSFFPGFPSPPSSSISCVFFLSISFCKYVYCVCSLVAEWMKRWWSSQSHTYTSFYSSCILLFVVFCHKEKEKSRKVCLTFDDILSRLRFVSHPQIAAGRGGMCDWMKRDPNVWWIIDWKERCISHNHCVYSDVKNMASIYSNFIRYREILRRKEKWPQLIVNFSRGFHSTFDSFYILPQWDRQAKEK